MEEGLRQSLHIRKEKAVLVACLLPGKHHDPHDPLGELRALIDTAGGVTVDEMIQNRAKPAAATYIGTGKVKELAEMVRAHQADLAVFDNDMTPAQISNLEEALGCKVLDRSEVILDIFAARARTAESRLQVELAQLQYTYPRLRAMWSHLDSIVGGAPTGIGTRGPGEQQLEVDRRIVKNKISDLRRQITQIQGRKEREVAARNKDFFTVGLVGYTNAGKSTLFNTLTDGDAYADDRLFATLSTRTRKWTLGGSDAVMLSDTVGFVRDLPHHLVASFRATLEEAVHSDILLIVLDAADPRARQQLDTVESVLHDLGVEKQERILLLNKTDKLEHNADLLVWEKERPGSIAISAKTGRGLDLLVERIRAASRGKVNDISLSVPISDGKAISFIESRGKVTERNYNGTHAVFKVRIGSRQLDQLRATGAKVTVVE